MLRLGVGHTGQPSANEALNKLDQIVISASKLKVNAVSRWRGLSSQVEWSFEVVLDISMDYRNMW